MRNVPPGRSTSAGRSMTSTIDRSPSEPAGGEAGHTDVGPEERTGQRVLARREALLRRGDEELAARPEGAGGRLARRHLDDLVEPALGRVAADRSAGVERDPDAAVRIDGQA